MDVVLRATAMFAIVYLLLRLLGKREIGQMTPFDLVSMVVIGDLIQQGITHNDFSLTGATLAISTFAFWSLVLGWVAYLFPIARKVLNGEPRLIIRDGHVLKQAMRQDRLTLDEVKSEMRLAGISDVSDVRFAVLEPQGKISFIKTSEDEGVKKNDEIAAG